MSNEELGKTPKKFKRRIRWGRLLLFIIISIALVAGSFFLGRMAFRILFAPKVPVVAATEDIGTDEILNKRINVLLLGIDDGDSEDFGTDAPKRTDAMMVVSFDTEHNEVSILSIPRDTRVSIPGHRAPDKINAAYAYGGINLAKQTVANLLQIPIHYYILANWQGFIQVMDILGGVDLYVDHNMNYEDPYANLKIHLQQGFQHLDGEKAGEPQPDSKRKILPERVPAQKADGAQSARRREGAAPRRAPCPRRSAGSGSARRGCA